MKIFILILTILLTINLISCASTQTKNPEEILDSSLYQEKQITVSKQSLDMKTNDLPYIPVLLPAEVAKIWIYPHVTPTVELVSGHWIFIKINDSKWYLEDYNSLKNIEISNSRIPLPPVTDKK